MATKIPSATARRLSATRGRARKKSSRESRHYGAAVIHRSSSSTRTKAILGSLSLMAFACALAQAPQSEVASPAVSRPQPVALVSGACPAVSQGGAISFDWNPGFDPSWGVTGMKSFRLVFQLLRADGVHVNPASRLLLDSAPRGRITAIGNGYFHIEARVPPFAHRGTYHLVAAHSAPELLPDYQGDAPKMTVSPVREYFCITVVPTTRPSSSSPPE
jgi:hypothetical protein